MLILAAPLVIGVRVALWTLPSRFIVRVAGWLAGTDHPESRLRGAAPVPLSDPVSYAPSTRVATIVWAIDAVSRRVPRATCLTQAIAGQLLLLAFGCRSRLCLGVARADNGGLHAHAWLEHHGRAVLGGAGVQSLARLPVRPHGTRVYASPPHS